MTRVCIKSGCKPVSLLTTSLTATSRDTVKDAQFPNGYFAVSLQTRFTFEQMLMQTSRTLISECRAAVSAETCSHSALHPRAPSASRAFQNGCAVVR